MIDFKQLPKYWMQDAFKIDLKKKYEPQIRDSFKEMDEFDIIYQLNYHNCVYVFRMVGESFIREYLHYIENWDNFWYAFRASEEFMRECPVKNWRLISKYQKLSEKFIEEFEDRVDWDEISEHQELSKQFCYKHKKDVNWASISATQDWY